MFDDAEFERLAEELGRVGVDVERAENWTLLTSVFRRLLGEGMRPDEATIAAMRHVMALLDGTDAHGHRAGLAAA